MKKRTSTLSWISFLGEATDDGTLLAKEETERGAILCAFFVCR
jgi:hypothetical protein